jgi:chemotaxis response regulator CheB
VLVVGMPGLLRDIVRETLAGHNDIDVVEDGDANDPMPAIGRVEPETVVWCAHRPPPERTLDALLYAHPRLRILMVVGEGRRGLMHELVPQTSVLGEISPQLLLSAVRGAVGETD